MTDVLLKDELIKNIKQNIKSGKHQEAFGALCAVSSPEDDFIIQTKYVSLLNMITKDLTGLKKVRIAILSSSTATHFKHVLRFWLAKEGFDANIYEAEYGTIQQTILDNDSQLYQFAPEVVLLFTNYRDVKCDIAPGSTAEAAADTVNEAVNGYVSLWKALQQRLNCHIIQNNADIPYSRVYGNYEATAAWGNVHALRQFNMSLIKAVKQGVTILDIEFLASVYGRRRWHDSRFWYHSKHAFALDASGLVSHEIAKTIGALKGSAKKCIVLDLDNTLWGGIIGDDGLEGIELGVGPIGEAFVDFQKYILKLKERGIILAVCSKNEEETAKEPFLKHPDMVLKLDDIVIFKANWNDKVSNIREIAERLNIGLDSMVFIDDNPVEREFVKGSLPMVTVPTMSFDPVDYINIISSGSYFETVAFSQEDQVRSDYYRSNVIREEFQNKFSDLSQYLVSLNMEMIVGSFDDFHLPRIAQLINKSNQFHLTTTRYSEKEIASISQSKDRFGLYFKLKDRFGDNGLISAVILEQRSSGQMYIDTWVMSCRVLSRGVEEFICSQIINFARERKCQKIIGKYIPTAKNKLVADLYKRLNFSMIKDEEGTTTWELDLKGKVPSYNSFIKEALSQMVGKVDCNA